MATDDFDLMHEAFTYKRDIEKEWQDMKNVLTRYSEHFDAQLVDRGLFMRIFAQVCSRCFGWGLPTTAMIPMADNLNHSHGTCINEAVHREFQARYLPRAQDKNYGGVPKKYFTREKFMNDYSTMFDETYIEQYPVNILGGRFSRENFKKNIEKYSLQTWQRELKEGVPLWSMTYKEEDYEEDNDTEEEDEESEDEDPEATHQRLMQDLTLGKDRVDGRLAKLINPKKGFKFFIE